MRWLAAALLATAVAAAVLARPALAGLSFVIRAANMQGAARRLADLGTRPVSERTVEFPAGDRTLRARVYWPGLAVVTPDIPELSRFAITPAITDAIERAALWVATSPGLTRDGRVGVVGISFSGGLSVVAAGRASLSGRVAFVLSFGGHDDLPRVLRYLRTGVEPAPAPGAPPIVRPPHDYGVAVILLGIADRMVPPDQVEPLRAAVSRFLWTSHLNRVDRAQAGREFAALREIARHMPEPAATLLGYVNDRDVARLGPRLLPEVGFYGGAPALSPSRSPKPSAPVFLLHGTDDNVIPAVESEYLAEDLRGHAPVRLLVSGLISHAEADRPPHIGEVWKLASFWGDVLRR